MAIYHLSVKTVSRSDGRSATAAAAYRAGSIIKCESTGLTHDYRKKCGVYSSTILLPPDAPEWSSDRANLWNAAEASETRKNSTVAREFEIALPSELDAGQRQKLAIEFARELVAKHGFAADVAIHEPGRGGDSKNHHAHILVTTRRLGPEGFTEKTRELDDKKSKEVEFWRERFSVLQNEHLAAAGRTERVDHRSHADRGISAAPGTHQGPVATAIARRGKTPRRSVKKDVSRPTHIDEEIKRLEALKASLEKERQEEISRTQELRQRFTKHQAAAAAQHAADVSKKEAEKSAQDLAAQKILKEIQKPKLRIRGGYGTPRSGSAQNSQFRPWRAPNGVTVYLAAKRDGNGRRAAFSDAGDQVNVHMHDNPAAIADAIKLAGQKFPDGLTITGTREFREAAEEEAKKQGLTVLNPVSPVAPPSGPKFRPR